MKGISRNKGEYMRAGSRDAVFPVAYCSLVAFVNSINNRVVVYWRDSMVSVHTENGGEMGRLLNANGF